MRFELRTPGRKFDAITILSTDSSCRKCIVSKLVSRIVYYVISKKGVGTQGRFETLGALRTIPNDPKRACRVHWAKDKGRNSPNEPP